MKRLLRRLSHWRTHETHLAEELQFHRDMIERDFLEQGASPVEARYAARRAMGNETLTREEVRGVWIWPHVEHVWKDVQYALRSLRRNPGFTAGVLLTLGLGIGATTAMFSVLDRLLFQYPARMIDPRSVHRVYLYRTTASGERETGGQYARFADMARWTTNFSQTAGVLQRELAVGQGEATRRLQVAVVSASFFEFFDATPVAGRYFTSADDDPANPAAVAVLSYSTWVNQFGERHDVLGSVLQIGAIVYTIIGVAPPGFVGLSPYQPPAIFIPLTTFASSQGRPNWQRNYGFFIGVEAIARRKPEVSLAAASADLTNALRRSIQAEHESGGRVRANPVIDQRALAGSIIRERRPTPTSITRLAAWLGGVTLIVLLVAIANVANLLLVRSITRRREFAVRISLGMGHARLAAQLLTESVVLSALGGMLGVVIGQWASTSLRVAFLPPTVGSFAVFDLRTLVFAAATAVGVGILTSIPPALQARHASLTNDLATGGREGSFQRTRLRFILLTMQVALSVILLVGAGLFVRSVQHAGAVPLGFDPNPVLSVDIVRRGAPLDSAALAALRIRLVETAKTLPGVQAAALRESVPLMGRSSWLIWIESGDSLRRVKGIDMNSVSADYFRTMGTRILRGRGIADFDRAGVERVMVVSESMARALWSGAEPLGKCVRIAADTMPCTRVVGVAEDINANGPAAGESVPEQFYLPTAQWQPQEGGLFVRANGDAGRLVEPLRQRLQREMPGASYVIVSRLRDQLASITRSWVVGARLFGAFGALTLLLAAVGLYSVVGYNVEQRKHELGVRIALGAETQRILRLIITDCLRLGSAGAFVGLAIALAAGKFVAPLLYKESPRDPSVIGVVAVVMLFVIVLAGLTPALRAARTDPRLSLQSD
jgi:predicted permease